jgi:DnaJ-class molecular chaperone
MVDQEEECRKIIDKKDYYDILGIEKTADETQIKKAYRKLAIKFHPDKNKAKSAEEAFKKVNQAFSVLSDKSKRKNYDMFGTEEGLGMSTIPEDFNPFDIFEQFFGDLGGSGFSGFGGGPGHTRISFNNGSGSFTVFSSGFGGNTFFSNVDDDGDFNPFEELFLGSHRRQRNNNRSTNNNRRSNEQSRRDLERNMKNATLFVQFFPLICCVFIFFIIPWLIRTILP